MTDYRIAEMNVLSQKISHFQLRNYSSDKTLSKDGSTLLTILLPARNNVYSELVKLSKDDYNSFKNLIKKR